MSQTEKDLELVLDAKALAKMGLHTSALYEIVFDLNSPLIISKQMTPQEKDELKEHNKKARIIRNELLYALLFKIQATKHLESSWFITKEKLPETTKILEEIREQMTNAGFDNVYKRVRIIPILTTEEGYEDFQDMKFQFLLQFTTEHIKYCDNAIEEQRISKSNLWRVKKAYEIVNLLADELESDDKKAELRDTSEILSDKISQVEAMISKVEEERKEEEEKKKQK